MPVSEPLPHFVDDLLGYLHETHPTHATLDGVHTHQWEGRPDGPTGPNDMPAPAGRLIDRDGRAAAA